MNSENLLQSKLFKGIILSIAGIIILVFVFGLGVFVGTKKADFSFRWAEDYHKNFGAPFLNANGVFGQIININNNILTVKDNDGDNTEKTVLVVTNATIIMQRKNIKLTDLNVGDNIVVIGSPNISGQIQAQLIRVMPSDIIKN